MNPIYRFSLGAHPPIYHMLSGETISVELPDADGLGANLQPLANELFESGDSAQGNPVYGPIHVAGARPGDALEIEFLKFSLNPVGRTLLAPYHGFLPDHLLGNPVPGKPAPHTPRHMYRWKIGDGFARLENPLGKRGIARPLQPFLGCVGTAPARSQSLSSVSASNHGGNLDHPDLVRGSKLLLPVMVDGALLHLGDLHAAQGHGEVIGGGIESSGRVTMRIRLLKEYPLRSPRYQTKTGFACLAVQGSFEEAGRHALAELVAWLVETGWNRYDAYLAISQCCELRPGGLTAQYSVVSCHVPMELLGDA